MPTNQAGISNYQEFQSVTKANIKNQPGAVFALRVVNRNALARYFLLIDKATAPAGGETALYAWVIPGGTTSAPGVLQLDIGHFNPSQHMPTAGISWGINTTAAAGTTQTFVDSATAADHDVEINFA